MITTPAQRMDLLARATVAAIDRMRARAPFVFRDAVPDLEQLYATCDDMQARAAAENELMLRLLNELVLELQPTAIGARLVQDVLPSLGLAPARSDG